MRFLHPFNQGHQLGSRFRLPPAVLSITPNKKTAPRHRGCGAAQYSSNTIPHQRAVAQGSTPHCPFPALSYKTATFAVRKPCDNPVSRPCFCMPSRSKLCPMCGRKLPPPKGTGRPRKYCPAPRRCRQRAAELAPRQARVAPSSKPSVASEADLRAVVQQYRAALRAQRKTGKPVGVFIFQKGMVP